MLSKTYRNQEHLTILEGSTSPVNIHGGCLTHTNRHGFPAKSKMQVRVTIGLKETYDANVSTAIGNANVRLMHNNRKKQVLQPRTFHWECQLVSKYIVSVTYDCRVKRSFVKKTRHLELLQYYFPVLRSGTTAIYSKTRITRTIPRQAVTKAKTILTHCNSSKLLFVWCLFYIRYVLNKILVFLQ